PMTSKWPKGLSAKGSLESVNLRMHEALKRKSLTRILWAVAKTDNVAEIVSWINNFIEKK
ncbi:MAG: hypothetical protein K0B01_14900, partial [Syntrophobacterales bacterium]|nr:hypothetical protein [Syntrophobacterales bacterium]